MHTEIKEKHYALLGGDIRMKYAAAALPGKRRWLFWEEGEGENALPLPDESVILPYPLTKDGVHLHAPLCKNPPTLTSLAPWLSAEALPEYWEEEGFLSENAVLTAAALAEIPGLLPPPGAKIGILGFGRVAKSVAERCLAGGWQVDIFCRRAEAREEAKALGCGAYAIGELGRKAGQYALLLGTIPVPLLTKEMLDGFTGLYGELASHPGLTGDALPPAHILKLSGLPGKYFPKEAGEAIARAVLRGEGRKC